MKKKDEELLIKYKYKITCNCCDFYSGKDTCQVCNGTKLMEIEKYISLIEAIESNICNIKRYL